MAFQGQLSEHSLAKIFQFIQRGFRTGLLSINADQATSSSLEAPHYIWFHSGRIMAVTRDREHTGLLEMLRKRQWLSTAAALVWQSQLTNLAQPLGSRLYEAQTLDAEQLRLLFHAQVIQPICALFRADRGEFYFDEKIPPVWSEMTGMSITAGEVILLGLRVLRNWHFLENQLPTAEKSLKKLRSSLPALKLDTQEVQVWQLADGETSLAQIAQETNLSIPSTRQVGWRLMMTDLVQEVVPTSLSYPVMINTAALQSRNTDFNIFTTDLKRFLQKKI